MSLDPDLVPKINKFLEQHGEAALEALLNSGHLFDQGMRDGSKLALKHSADYVDAGVPCSLVFTFDPRNKKAGLRTDVRLVTGESKQITIEIPAEEDELARRRSS